MKKKKKISTIDKLEKKRSDRHRRQEEEYGRDEFLFGAAEDEYEDGYEDDYEDDYADDEAEYEDDYEVDDRRSVAQNKSVAAGEVTEEIPEFDEEDPDFFTRELDPKQVQKAYGVASLASSGDEHDDEEDDEDYDFYSEAVELARGAGYEVPEDSDSEDDEDFEDDYEEDEDFEDDSDDEDSDDDDFEDDESEYEDEDYYEDEEYYEDDDEDFDRPVRSKGIEKKKARGREKRNERRARRYGADKKSSKNKDKKSAKGSRAKSKDSKGGKNSKNKKTGFLGSVVYFFQNMSTGDRLIATSGVFILIIAIVVGTVFVNTRALNEQIASFGEVAAGLDDMTIIGAQGIDAAMSARANYEPEEEFIEEEEVPMEMEAQDSTIQIVMKVSTIQSDLKIKFADKNTDKLISGIPFAVTVTSDGGKTYDWTDENKDGLMYHTEVPNGTYKVVMKELTGADAEKYQIASEISGIKVTDKIAYKKVDIADEVKTEAEVNAAAEDTGVQDIAVESTLTDTVEWVESTKTLIGGSEDSYESVDKSDIADPTKTSKAIVETTSCSWTMPYMAAPADENVGGNIGGGDGGQGGAGDNGDQGGAGDNGGQGGAGDNGDQGGAGDNGGQGGAGDNGDQGGAGDNGGQGAGDNAGQGAGDNGQKPGSQDGDTNKEKDLSVSISPGDVNAKTTDDNKTIVASAAGGSGKYKYEWSSSDGDVVGVSGGGSSATLIFNKPGTATITVKITGTVNGETKETYTTMKVTVDAGYNSGAKLETKSGKQVYVKNSNGDYVKATAEDYYNSSKFYVAKPSSDAVYKYTGWQTLDGYTYFFDKDGNYVTGEQVIQGAKYSFDSNGHLSSGSGTMGIDVSKWNGSIDWNAVANSGVSYVIIRCGYRGSSTGALIEDPTFRTNISGAKAAGLKVGAYFFTQAVNEVEAVEEASMAVNLCSKYGLNLPLFLDVEAAHGRADGIGADARTAVVKAFCQTVQNSGYTAGVYANKTWFSSYMHVGQLTGYKIWLAQYAAAPTYTSSRFDYWQYSSKGSIPGIKGNVDLNIRY